MEAPSPQRPASAARAGHERPPSARRVRPTSARPTALAGADADVRWVAAGQHQGGGAAGGPESEGATAGGSDHAAEPSGVITLPRIADQGPEGHSSTPPPRMARAHTIAALLPVRAAEPPPAMLRDDGACLHADNVQALASATAEDQAAYVRQLERDLEDGGVCGASAAGAEAEQEGVPAAIRRRYFARHSDGAAVDGPHAFEIVLAGTEADSSCRDHLTWYYCDFLEAAPAGPAPPFTKDNTTTAEDLLEWLHVFKPRTRTDAYPMLQVAIVALHKIVHREVQMRSQQAETLIRLK